MAMTVAVQMDPISPIDIGPTGTFRPDGRGERREVTPLFYYTPDRVAYVEGPQSSPGAGRYGAPGQGTI